MQIAERWLVVKHECPFCKYIQEDESEPGDLYKCVECKKEYELGDC